MILIPIIELLPINDLHFTPANAGEMSSMLVGLASVISAIGSACAAVLAAKNSRKIEEVHKATNGMKDDLVQSTGDKRYAEGIADAAGDKRYKAGVIRGEDHPRHRLIKKRNLKREQKPKTKRTKG